MNFSKNLPKFRAMKVVRSPRISLAVPNASGTVWSIKIPFLDKISRRLRFVITLSIFAAIYGAIWAYRLLAYQADAFSDITKMTGLIFIVTLIMSYFWWTVIVMISKRVSAKGGALAGFLTAICVIPLPTFFGAVKGDFVANHDLMSAIGAGITYSISTFSLAEALALPLSTIVGLLSAR